MTIAVDCREMSMVSCQKEPTRHAYAWQIGPFWQDTLDVCLHVTCMVDSQYSQYQSTYALDSHIVFDMNCLQGPFIYVSNDLEVFVLSIYHILLIVCSTSLKKLRSIYLSRRTNHSTWFRNHNHFIWIFSSVYPFATNQRQLIKAEWRVKKSPSTQIMA